MRFGKPTTVVLAALLLNTTMSTAAFAQAEPDGIHDDVSRAAYCMRAQQEVAGTELVSTNVIHLTPETFVESDATPYEADEGRDLPLTTHQLITSIPHPAQDRMMESVVSCKLKGGEAIQRHFGQDQGELGRFCSDAHADITDRVFAALTPAEIDRLVYSRGDVVMDPDIPSMGGGDWTSGQPQGGDFTLPQIAYEEADGNLHLRSKALIVPTATVDIPPFVPRNKQGTHYCHLIAPDHLRELITGGLTASAPAPDPEPAPEPAPDPEPAPQPAPAANQTNSPGTTSAQAGTELADTGGGAVPFAALPLLASWALLPRRRRP